MKLKTFTIVLITSLLLGSASAQISISAANLPDVGDQNDRYLDTEIETAVISEGSGEADEVYEFDELNGSSYIREQYVDPATVDTEDLFPSANLARISQDQIYQELLIKNDDGIRVLGGISINPINTSQSLKWEVSDDYYLRKTPLNYEDSRTQEVSVFAAISSSFLPDSVLEEFQIKPDSFRFKVDINSESTVDGYGTMYVNDYNSVEVLRQDFITRTDPKVEAKASFTGWIDVSSFIEQFYPQLSTFFEKDTINSYRYYSKESKFSVVEAEREPMNDEIESVNYSTTGLTTSLFEADPDAHGYDISVNPNPSVGKVKMKVQVKEPGDYKVRVLNIVGYQLWSDEYFIYDSHEEELNFSHLKRGTYFYSLVSPDGKTLVTKRMLIVGA